MYLELINDATDYAESLDITSIAKEKGGLRIGTAQGMILFVGPFDEVADVIVDLVGRPDLPELRHPQRVHSLQELLDALAQGQDPT